MAAILAGDAAYAEPVNLEAFALPAGAGQAQDRFRGRLRFAATPADARSRLVADPWKIATPDASWAVPPAFDFAFVQEGSHLVPVERGIVAGDGNWWDWIVGPGRVWRDGDEGWSRAAVPFALMEKNANCLHNGVLTFRFRGDAEVSRVAWQISQETCHYLQLDAWGSAPAAREQGDTPDAESIGAAYRNEVARRLPVRPIGQLREDYPGLDPASFGSSADIPPR